MRQSRVIFGVLTLALSLLACGQGPVRMSADGARSLVRAQALGVSATFGTSTAWEGGFTGTITLKNAGAAPVKPWLLKFKFEGDAAVSGSPWGAAAGASKASDGTWTFAPNTWGGDTIPAGASVSIAYNGSGTFAGVSACTLNGSSCDASSGDGGNGGGSGGGGGTVTPLPGEKVDLSEPRKKDVAMQLVSSAENSSLNWRAQFGYIEDIGDGRGYTAGIIGFCSGTGDMLELIEDYTRRSPGNSLAKYLPALRRVNGSDSHAGLGPAFEADWRRAAAEGAFQDAQEGERDRVYFDPAVAQAKADGLRALGQFAYYDAAVMHGFEGMQSVRRAALERAKTPAQGGDERTYLSAFLDARVVEMKKEAAHDDTSRVDTAQRVFLQAGNFDLKTPLSWKVYGEPFSVE